MIDSTLPKHPQHSTLSRRGLLKGSALAVSTLAAQPVQARNIFDFLFGTRKKNNQVRRLHMYSLHNGEKINTVYWLDGEYIPDSLTEIKVFMRDWRADKAFPIDPRVLDILAATHRLLETSEPFGLLSGYRTAATNAYLRRYRGGVARNSFHTTGQAADISLKSRNVKQIAAAAQVCAAGGVGRYFKSGFVHVDCGQVRQWG